MPLFLDTHPAHPASRPRQPRKRTRKDLAVQDKYGVRYLKYWYDPATGKVFCLSEAPSKEAAWRSTARRTARCRTTSSRSRSTSSARSARRGRCSTGL